jgi:hypothetical protein
MDNVFYMLHPDTELRFISHEIGYGVFATQDLPLGTITWVKDSLDRSFKKEEVDALPDLDQNNLLKYTYRDRKGLYLFCWDLTRYINHSFIPNSMLTPLDFEIAIRFIKKGDEITNDYGTLNIIEPFACLNTQGQRNVVRPDDLLTFYRDWDHQLSLATKEILHVPQSLEYFLSGLQKEKIKNIASGKENLPSILENFFRG